MPADPARVLLEKARDDQRLALLVVGRSEVTDEQIGFLSQQAVEKAVKAVLSHHGLPYRRTHDLVELLDLLTFAKVPYPCILEEGVNLTPFAAEMRYDYLPPEDADDEPLDREAMMRVVVAAVDWAAAVLSPPSFCEPGQ
jgi:HEPN domain-containing protein